MRKVVIVGVGLMGGSLGMALLHNGAALEVVGVGRNPANLEKALELGAITSVGGPEAAADADLVVLATPVGSLVEVARSLTPHLKPETVVTDMGSTKREVVRILEETLPPGIDYVGGHPMTGAESTGVGAADPYLYENAVYLLTPTSNTREKALARVRSMVEAVGARPLCLSPEEHDRIVSAVSHLPHLVAVALVQAVAELAKTHPQALFLAAGGFRDTTRVAMGDPLMWRDICQANREQVLEALALFRQALDRLEAAVVSGSGQALEACFKEAREVRSQIPARLRGFLPSQYEAVVTVPDQPGEIGRLGDILGLRGVNICDLEILRVREGEGGTIRLAFRDESQLGTALQILREVGYRARRR